MTSESPNTNTTGHGDFERRDIGVAGVLYFLLGLAVFCLIMHFLVTGLFSVLENRSQEQQTPVSPLVTNAPEDTRHLPAEYKTDNESTAYEKYLKKNFPAPQLETDERSQLNKVRLAEEQTLNTYDYIDQKVGTVRIPIERAMDLIAQRGLPVRTQGAATTSMPPQSVGSDQAKNDQGKKKGKKK